MAKMFLFIRLGLINAIYNWSFFGQIPLWYQNANYSSHIIFFLFLLKPLITHSPCRISFFLFFFFFLSYSIDKHQYLLIFCSYSNQLIASLHPAVTITNIRNFIPIILEKDDGQNTSWVELFKIHYRAHEVIHHILPQEASISL